MCEHELWNELGNLYFLSGAYDSAIHAYTKAIELDGKFGRPYSNMALVHIQRGQYDRAIELLRRSTDLLTDPREKAISWNRLGNVYRQRKDYYMAVAAYQKADEVDPRSKDEHDQPGPDADAPLTIRMPALNLSLPAEEPKAPESAPDETSRAEEPQETAQPIASRPPVELLPNEAGVLDDIFSFVPPDLPEEEPYDFNGYLFGPDEEFIPPEPGPILVTRNNFPQPAALPVSVVEEAEFPLPVSLPKSEPEPVKSLPVSVPPERPINEANRTLFSLGQALRGATNSELSLPLADVAEELPFAVAVKPEVSIMVADEMPEYAPMAAEATEEHGIAETSAITDLKSAVGKDPRDAAAWDALGNAYTANGQYEEAVMAYEQAASLQTRNASFIYHLGLAYATVDRDNDAVGLFKRTVELDPKDALAHATLAGCYRRLGLEELARKQVEKARMLNRTFQNENEYNRACLEAICGNTDLALEYLDLALQTRPTYADWALQDPDLDFIRHDPRFEALLSRYVSSMSMEDEKVYATVQQTAAD